MPIYDVENRFSYYKSYSDNILVGPSKPKLGDTTWLRFVSGSIVSGSEEWKASTVLSDYTYKKANPFFRSGEVRYLRLSSREQTIEDSITPDIISLYLTGSASGSIGFDSKVDSGSLLFALYFATDGFSITSSGGTLANQRVNNTEFFQSFPFEKKYSFVQKQKPEGFAINNIATVYGSSTTFELDSTNTTFGDRDNDLYNYTVICLTKSGSQYNSQSVVLNYFTDYAGNYNGSIFDKVASFGFGYGNSFVDNSFSKKLIFGINPEPIGTILSSSIGPSSQSYLPVYCTGSTIEGWKYGLYNGIPTNFSAVFRQNHYGQFRDMLEQRIYTKTYNNKFIGGPLDTDGGINFISGSSLLGESNNWLTASIYSGTDVSAAYTVNPYGSGIFDKEYRVSQPWHDNDLRIGK